MVELETCVQSRVKSNQRLDGKILHVLHVMFKIYIQIRNCMPLEF